MKYVDAKGKEQRPVRCAKLRGGDDHIIGNGWYAVTGNISYASGMIVWGETNLILCGGAGIGAGFYCNASKGKVVITGGRVMATGGNGGAGIGGGKEDVNSGGEGANVEIGGTADVTAWAGGTNEYALCSAIGRGHKDSNFGTLKLSDNMLVRAGAFNRPKTASPALRTSGRMPAKTTGTPTSSPATIQTRPFPTSTTRPIPWTPASTACRAAGRKPTTLASGPAGAGSATTHSGWKSPSTATARRVRWTGRSWPSPRAKRWMSTVTPGRTTPSRNGTPKRTAAARPTPTGPCPKADQQAKRVGDPDPALTYTCATKLADGDSLTGELVRDKGERIGQYRIRIGTLNAGDNYDIRFKESWLVILSRTLPIPTATPQPTATPKPTEKPQPAQRDYTLLARLKNVGKKGTSLQLA